jgi:pyrroloquinoline quinone biosynthesis protein B
MFGLGQLSPWKTAVSAGGGFPGFVPEQRAGQLDVAEAVLGIVLEHLGRRAALFPAVPRLRPDWMEVLKTCDVVFFDGTFWSNDELVCLNGSGKTAREMGHQPVRETLGLLAELGTRKIFIHINNTNPILDEDSDEFRQARDAGWEIGRDGMDVIL